MVSAGDLGAGGATFLPGMNRSSETIWPRRIVSGSRQVQRLLESRNAKAVDRAGRRGHAGRQSVAADFRVRLDLRDPFVLQVDEGLDALLGGGLFARHCKIDELLRLLLRQPRLREQRARAIEGLAVDGGALRQREVLVGNGLRPGCGIGRRQHRVFRHRRRRIDRGRRRTGRLRNSTCLVRHRSLPWMQVAWKSPRPACGRTARDRAS